MTTRELFDQVTSERGWYKPLGWTWQKASKYKNRAKKGDLSEGKMYEILVSLGYVYSWKKT